MRPSRYLAALLVLSLAACAPDRATSPTPRAELVAAEPDSVIRMRLERAADGLLYTSESDYPFTWFAAAGPASSPLTIDAMRAIVGAPADAPAQVISLDTFFARHIERVDPYDSVAVSLVPRYVRLRETIRHTLPDVQVFRIGAIQVHCYLVGLDRDGHVVGLETIAIET